MRANTDRFEATTRRAKPRLILSAVVALLLVGTLMPVSPASATHESNSPSPSGANCEWYGSAEWSRRIRTDRADGSWQEDNDNMFGWSGPSSDGSCRGSIHRTHRMDARGSNGECYHAEAEGTVPAHYEAYVTSDGFSAGFGGDRQIPYSSGCEDPSTTTMDAGLPAIGCVVPGFEDPEVRDRAQAVVISCTTTSSSDGYETGTYVETYSIRMRRTVCDRTIDSDGDKLSDCREFALQTDTHNPDTDGDGLTDGQEVLTYGTDPRKADTDGGGVSDGAEIAAGTNPNDASDDGPGPSPSPSPTPSPTPTPEPCDGLNRSDIVGRQPSYVSLDKKLSSFPNRAAACSGMWAPHLDAGFIPQGIAPTGDHIWVAGYLKTHKDDKPVECAVYLMDPKTGRRGLGYVFTKEHLNWASVAAGFDTPRKCGHAGGVSVLPDGRLLVADTSSLFVVNPAAFGNSNPIEQVIKLVDPDDGAFNGSFLVDGISSSDPNLATIWIGTFDKGYAGKLREVTVAEILDDNTLSAGDASPDPILLPVKSQGGAFAANGDLWIASSTSGCGMVTRFDAATGEHESFGFGPGAEEISFVGDRLWGAFEAGTRLYQKKFFPLIASFDPSKIVEKRSELSLYCLGLLPL